MEMSGCDDYSRTLLLWTSAGVSALLRLLFNVLFSHINGAENTGKKRERKEYHIA